MRPVISALCGLSLLVILEVAGGVSIRSQATDPLPDFGEREATPTAPQNVPAPMVRPRRPDAGPSDARGQTSEATTAPPSLETPDMPPPNPDPESLTDEPLPKGIKLSLVVDPRMRDADLAKFLRQTGSVVVMVRKSIDSAGMVQVRDAILPGVAGLPSRPVSSNEELTGFLDAHPQDRCLWVTLRPEASSAFTALLSESSAIPGVFLPHLVFGEAVSGHIWQQHTEQRGDAADVELKIVAQLIPDDRQGARVEVKTRPLMVPLVPR